MFCTGTVARANLGTTTCSPGRQDQASGRGGSRGARDGGESQHPVMNARGRHRKWSSNRARPVLSQLCASLLQPQHGGWGGRQHRAGPLYSSGFSFLISGGWHKEYPPTCAGGIGEPGPRAHGAGSWAASCRRPLADRQSPLLRSLGATASQLVSQGTLSQKNVCKCIKETTY